MWFINEGYKRPSQLQCKILDASQRVLYVQLKELEEHELVSKVFTQLYHLKWNTVLQRSGRL
ncbi:winged helix-turn-helix transcriptional regulator [Sphingobacterium sp.]|uniref:winged helix-turn-helix transcriptional regulator n=1 Tax=Sphingobacterium sp. TaxID=341027 RepID=UPI00391855DC